MQAKVRVKNKVLLGVPQTLSQLKKHPGFKAAGVLDIPPK
jgi:hypothetical protein